MSKHTTIIFLLFFLFSCGKFEYSPYEIKKENLPSNLNAENISKLLSMGNGSDDTIRIFLCGDSQRFYDELDAMVNKANTTNCDFVVLAGDITDFGLGQEFGWIYGRLQKLQAPYFCVVGNHDLLGNGSRIYEQVFGEKDFSFVFKQYKFLFHNSNGLEYGFNGTVPNVSWVQSQLQGNDSLYYAGFSHIAPFDMDFDPALKDPYKNTLAAKARFTVSMHGHMHDRHDSYFYNDHVRYIVTNTIGKREALLIKLCRQSVIKEILAF